MERKLVFRVREDIDARKIMDEAEFLDCGASKYGYAKGETCYKIPLGYEEIDMGTKELHYPYEATDYRKFIDDLCDYHEGLVWSIGQIVFEIMVWEHLVELEKQGYDISGFARIKDYYLDRNGVPIIEQEFIHNTSGNDYGWPRGWDFMEKNKKTLDALADMGFDLTDLRDGNIAYNSDGVLVCYDFGISHGSPIYDYDTYDSYNGRGYSDSYYY